MFYWTVARFHVSGDYSAEIQDSKHVFYRQMNNPKHNRIHRDSLKFFCAQSGRDPHGSCIVDENDERLK